MAIGAPRAPFIPQVFDRPHPQEATMQHDRSRPDELPFPDEEMERGGRRSREELEDAAVHPGDPGIHPPLEDDDEEAREELELP